MAITHQEIVDRMEALSRDHGKAYEIEQARIAKERESLRELCGGVGHVYANSPMIIGRVRQCCFCWAPEPVKA